MTRGGAYGACEHTNFPCSRGYRLRKGSVMGPDLVRCRASVASRRTCTTTNRRLGDMNTFPFVAAPHDFVHSNMVVCPCILHAISLGPYLCFSSRSCTSSHLPSSTTHSLEQTNTDGASQHRNVGRHNGSLFTNPEAAPLLHRRVFCGFEAIPKTSRRTQARARP